MPTPSTPRTLLLLRHAKAAKAVEADGTADIERPLAERGRADATAVGSWLDRSGVAVDLVLCSPSARTRETWHLAGGATAARVEEDHRIYEAGVDQLLAVLRDVTSSVRTVVVVGHAPSIPALTELLADPARSDHGALDAVRRKFPTSGLARLELEAAWADLDAGSAALVEFAVPRG